MQSRYLSLFFGALLLLNLPSTTLPARMSAQLFGGAQVVGTCPANCKLVQDITSIRTEESVEGVRVSVNWATAPLPAETQLVGFTVSVKLVLKDNKTADSGEVNIGGIAGSATVLVRGRIFNRNINLSDVKSGSALVKANVLTTNNPTVNVTSKEIIGNDGAEVNMRVRWTPPPIASPCLAERTVRVVASAQNASGIKFEGVESARLSAGSALVRLRGAGLRRNDLKNLQASLSVSTAALTCGLSKSMQSFGGATGSNP